MGFLEMILDRKRDLVREKKKGLPLDDLLSLTNGRGRKGVFFASLSERFTGQVKIIAEVKRSSPSRGTLCAADRDIAETILAYETGGASAISILTEGSRFNGSLEDLILAREVTVLPVLRKDFIADPYEIHEAAAFGADAVLLIAEALEREEIEDLAALACSIGLDVLLEVHSLRSFERTGHIEGVLTGVNSRDLTTLSIDLAKARDVVASIPDDRPVIVESGINTSSDIELFRDLGVSGFLVGTALMRSTNPEQTLRHLTTQKETDQP
jgi:indole-3-glycerol phosphate synthase